MSHVMFDLPKENSLRTKGRIFDGFTDPVNNRNHRLRKISSEERMATLTQLAMQYTGHYGVWANGGFADPSILQSETPPRIEDMRLAPNGLAELRVKLDSLLEYAPECTTSRIRYFQEIRRRRRQAPVPRVILLSDGDQQNIPPEYYDKFVYWFLENPDPSNLGRHMANSFDANLILLAWEARHAAQQSRKKSARQVFEEIIDQALEDADLTLEPLLSRAPEPVHALMLKTVVYMFLAREGLSPDGMLSTVNSNVRIAPCDYFTDESCTTFRSEPTCDGFTQLIAEGLLIPLENMWRSRPADNFNQMQSLLSVVQYVEDIVLVLPSFDVAIDNYVPTTID
ncbi:MAG: hypothetical protein KDD69_06495 [Bdellovibrionales bacterium]|nr:hypothetical protein [Bdellovibrionales bacterium]